MARPSSIVATLLALGLATHASAQADDPTLFVANNGNLEGSVSSLRIERDGSLTFVDVLVIGTGDDPGTNAQSIAVTPDGRYLAVGHGTAADDFEQLTVLTVAADGTLSLLETFLTLDSPLDLEWLRDDILAVTNTSISGTNNVLVYAFDDAPAGLTLIDTEPSGSFTTNLAVDREHGLLFSQDSTNDTVSSYRVEPDGTLTAIQTIGTGGIFPLGIGISPDGTKLYGGGGISGGGDKIIGVTIDPVTGALASMAGSPFVSPGASPKQVAVSGDNQFAIVAHGTDATAQVFGIDEKSGNLTFTGFSFDVGFQGTFSEVIAVGDLVFMLDNSTISDGVRGAHAFTLGDDGSLTPNGPLLDTQGISPWRMAAWTPASCTGDVDGDGFVNVNDLLAVLGGWGPCPPGPCAADVNGDDIVNVIDLLAVLTAFGPCP